MIGKVNKKIYGLLPVVVSIFCFIFGLCLIANINLAGDGVWYWYANACRSGERLYSGLGFA
ncbi:MAG: hypothetical protein WCK00_09030, partial [Deltaproteobacteria bacterium]